MYGKIPVFGFTPFLRVEVSSIKFPPPSVHYIGPTVLNIVTNTIDEIWVAQLAGYMSPMHQA